MCAVCAVSVENVCLFSPINIQCSDLFFKWIQMWDYVFKGCPSSDQLPVYSSGVCNAENTRVTCMAKTLRLLPQMASLQPVYSLSPRLLCTGVVTEEFVGGGFCVRVRVEWLFFT